MSPLQRLMVVARSLDPRLPDACLALALTLWALTQSVTLSDPAPALVLVGMPAAVAWRRRAPVAILAAEVAGLVVLPNRLELPQGVALLIAAYSAAFYSDRRVVVAALLIWASVWALAFASTVRIPSRLIPIVLVAPVWLGGAAMRGREQRVEAASERADRVERDREAALGAERARIARELHDLVTHSVSLMVLQTGAAREIMGRDERRSQALLESVQSSGRSALEELRHMLGLLSDQDGEAPLAPQPAVEQVPALIEHVRQAGLTVDLRVEGQPRPVSRGVGVAVYRIVQEALTNVIKHSAGAPSEVVVRWSDAAVELEIVDQGPPRAGAGRREGRGLAGMRERAAMYRGTLEEGPGLDRGYVVRARIPLEPGAT